MSFQKAYANIQYTSSHLAKMERVDWEFEHAISVSCVFSTELNDLSRATVSNLLKAQFETASTLLNDELTMTLRFIQQRTVEEQHGNPYNFNIRLNS